MDRLRLAVSLPVFGQPLKAALKSAAATGATGVLVDTRYQLKSSEFTESARRHLGRYLEELGLVLAVTVVGAIAGLIPAWGAYRAQAADKLGGIS